jgi:hypothetical protein
VRHVAGVGQAKLRPHVAGECGGVVRRRHLGQEGRGCGETGGDWNGNGGLWMRNGLA